jgi:GMP reductase
MKIEEDTKLDFQDVLIRPKRSRMASRKLVDLEKTYHFLNSDKNWRGVPIIAANLDTTGTFAMAIALAEQNMMTCLHKFYDPDKVRQFIQGTPYEQRAFKTIGGTMDMSLGWSPEFICIDVANGYTETFVDHVKSVRTAFPKSTIMAGNVATYEMTETLLIQGADIVKVGIGPGSLCTTRKVAGVGYPQLSAIDECADAAHGLGGHICADGGCTTPGDIVKAFGAGADFVMLGGMLAGTDECEGQWVYEHKAKFTPMDGMLDEPFGTKVALKAHGMSSKAAMEKHNGGQGEYRAAEGKAVQIPYKGPVNKVLQEITGGLRSGCAYVGAARLKDLPKCATFVRVSRTHNTIYGDA